MLMQLIKWAKPFHFYAKVKASCNRGSYEWK